MTLGLITFDEIHLIMGTDVVINKKAVVLLENEIKELNVCISIQNEREHLGTSSVPT